VTAISSARVLAAVAAIAMSGCRNDPPRPARVTVVGGGLDPRRFLGETAARAVARGAGPLEPLGASLVSEGDHLGRFISVPVDSCVLALARTGASVRDVDLFVFDDAGDTLAADESPQPNAAVMVCPPHPRRLYVAARIVSGTGILALGVLPVPKDRADAVAKEVEVRGRPGEDTGKLAAWPGLESKLRERRANLGSTWEDVRRAALSLDPHAAAAVTVPLEGGRCLDVFATPSEEVSSIELEIVDARGRVVARGKPPDVDQGAVVCSSEKQDLTIMLRPRLSYGSAALVLARTPIGAAAALADRIDVSRLTPLDPLARAITRHGERTAQLTLDKPRSAGEATVKVGAPAVVSVSREPGCSRIDVIGGAPLGTFSAELWSDDGALIDGATGGAVATLFACNRAPAKARVEVVSAEGGGPVSVQVRRGDIGDTALSRPLAAGRILAWLEASSGPIDFARLHHDVEAIDVADGSRFERNVPVPAGCSEWITAADEGHGLSAELLDDSGTRVAFSRGARSVKLGACVQAAFRGSLRITASGAAKLLLLSRQVG
jgi:hypothetical protein